MSDLPYHIPVLLEESVEHLIKDPDGIYVDVTFGSGGHSRKILEKLGANGRLIALDRDVDALENKIDDDRFTLIYGNFQYLAKYLRTIDVHKVDGVLADLGVSSHQFDVPERGFTFRAEADLDMRMNIRADKTAAYILNEYGEKTLVSLFSRFGEVRNSKTLAKKIVEARRRAPIETNSQFLPVMESCLIGDRARYFAQVYQALRIEVNEEMVALEQFLTQCPTVIKSGGRLVVISYHSLEDRLVKMFINNGRLFKAVNKKIILPNEEEQRVNSRSRSAKERVGEKI
ncbi:UNVERIFIED_CONTAM: hypothetical protein GTU68_014789 [Idotea baltica]|nr:hypothetical protein [Idotea baltica]